MSENLSPKFPRKRLNIMIPLKKHTRLNSKDLADIPGKRKIKKENNLD